jgi:intracellular septation protein A
MGLMLVFVLAQGIYLSRHLPQESPDSAKDPQ